MLDIFCVWVLMLGLCVKNKIVHNAYYFVSLRVFVQVRQREKMRGWHFGMPGRMWSNHENVGLVPNPWVAVQL